MMRSLTWIVLAVVLTGIGAAAGWYAAVQRQGAGRPDDGHDAAHEDGGGQPQLAEQTLRNLNVTTGTASLGTFTRSRTVLAVVVDPPQNTRPVYAPLGGIVTAIRAVPGTFVEAGDLLVTMTRDAIPRPELKLTAEILTPVAENLHESVSHLRTAASQLRIARAELERVQSFTRSGTAEGLPILPRKTEIDVRYEVERAEQDVSNARHELERHGLSDEEVAAIESGEPEPESQRLWKRALERNGLWNERTEAMLQALPEAERGLPWSVAAIGELAAAGLATDDLLHAMKETPHVSRHFVEIAGLLLQGHTVAHARLLAEGCALESQVELKAPTDGAATWDVSAIPVRPGQRITAGETIAVLHDPGSMRLRVEPVGQELADVVRAVEAASPVTARPLVSGSGPDLADLRIERLETRADDRARGSEAWITCRNELIAPPGEARTRSWKLRNGMRYVVAIPTSVLRDVFVLPATALTDDGPDRVVFVANGPSFTKRPVHVLWEDERTVVVAHDGSVFPGDPVVLTGAFQLGLALQAGTGNAGAHHGHQH